jgi:hypothetical protein
MYEKRGWKLDMDTHLLSFVSACGRWFDTYNKDNSQFCRINGDWIVSLVVSKDVEQEKVLPKEM